MKKILKSRKFIYASSSIVLATITNYIPGIDPSIPMYILAAGFALITGHTATDIAAIIKGAKKDN